MGKSLENIGHMEPLTPSEFKNLRVGDEVYCPNIMDLPDRGGFEKVKVVRRISETEVSIKPRDGEDERKYELAQGAFYRFVRNE